MSLRAILEVVLHFESFRNIDLFHQGLYQIRVRINHEQDGQTVPAVPYTHFSATPEGKTRRLRPDQHCLIPAHIIDDKYTFTTRSFVIRYCEEEVELNDAGHFRMELDITRNYTSQPLVLEAELMFADMGIKSGREKQTTAIPEVGENTEFKSVSKQIYKLHTVTNGLHEFVPMVFDEYHFCVANMMIHTVLLDFRFRLRPFVPALPASEEHSKNKQSASSPHSPGPVSFSEYLFPHASKGSGLGSDYDSNEDAIVVTVSHQDQENLSREAEKLHMEYTGMLAHSYTSLAENFQNFAQRCLSVAQRDQFGPAILVHRLEYPGEIDDSEENSQNVLPATTVAVAGVDGGVVEKKRNQKKRKIKFTSRVSEVTPHAVAALLVQDINCIAGQVFQLWHKMLAILPHCSREICALLKNQWESRMTERWGESIFRETSRTGDLAVPTDRSSPVWDVHNKIAETLRKSAHYHSLEPPEVEDMSMYPKMNVHPIVFEQRYLPLLEENGQEEPAPAISRQNHLSSPGESTRSYRGVHLFVLVHGFQGNSFDMRLMKNNLALLYPEAMFLSSNCNEEKTEGDIAEMGERLSLEVLNHISEWCPGNSLGRLSFVAHSLGGLIVRAALPKLEAYSTKMYTFLTLSSPHLGYMYNSNKLVDAGIWVLKKWRKSLALLQLTMTDKKDMRQTMIYKLSQFTGLEWFQHIILVSSYQDQYAPFDSARMEVGMKAENDPKFGAVYVEMARNVWRNVSPEKLYRFDVNFRIPEKTLDTLIGRAAHIQFLECQPLMKMFVHTYRKLFE
eukprot:GILK01005940.1.p1 GENE.GILK01005940.1~~GILK01005940.1.p1  ORF type:complete len:790 (+),score=102.98 GILK01005940.1:173-2542(+)